MTSPQPLSNFWRLVSQKCNNFLLAGSSRPTCLKFVIDGFFVGLIRPDMLSSLLRYPNIFVWISHPTSGERCISLHPSLDTIEKRTSAVSHAMLDLRQSNTVKALKGWRDEDYGVYVGERKQLLMSIERSASSLLGIVRYGVHINGYFIQPSTQKLLNSHRSSNGGCNLTSCTGDASELLSKYDPSRVMMWLGVRSLNKPTWPGMIDNMAAGGLSVGMDVIECAIKECQEEASIPIEFFDSLKPVGRLSYIFEDERGVCPQIEYIFDLELPPDFVPAGADGEVESFQLVSIEQTKELIFNDKFKENSALVVLDFLYRHKFIDPDSDPEHLRIQSLMHVHFDFD